jgi:hypothetical protein
MIESPSFHVAWEAGDQEEIQTEPLPVKDGGKEVMKKNISRTRRKANVLEWVWNKSPQQSHQIRK